MDQKSFGLRAKKGQIVRRGYFGGDFVHMRTNYWGARDHVLLGRFLCLRLFSSKTKMDFLSKEKQGVCVLNDLYQEVIPRYTAIPSLFTKFCRRQTRFLFQKILKLMT